MPEQRIQGDPFAIGAYRSRLRTNSPEWWDSQQFVDGAKASNPTATLIIAGALLGAAAGRAFRRRRK